MGGIHPSASIVIHASRIRRCGKASTASGTSHSENCGLHTLFVNRKTATTRNASWPSRGRRGAVSATYAIAAQHNANETATTVFSTEGGCQKPSVRSKPLQPVNDFTTLYNESMSSPRRVLSRKNSDQPRGKSTNTGRFTNNQVAAAAPALRPRAPRRAVRIPSTNIGPKNNSGYTLAAAPSPISTPASTGLRRAHTNSPAIANAVASASKLVNIWKIT